MRKAESKKLLTKTEAGSTLRSSRPEEIHDGFLASTIFVVIDDNDCAPLAYLMVIEQSIGVVIFYL